MFANLVLVEEEFIGFQRFCRKCGFDLCYFGTEIYGSEESIASHQFEGPKVIKLKTLKNVCIGIPFDIADWQGKKWNTSLSALMTEFFDETSKPLPQRNSASIDVRKQLVDQLKSVFISALLLLWAPSLISTNNMTLIRPPLVSWVIGSIVLLICLSSYKPKKPYWSKISWVFPVAGIVIFWVMYLLTGIHLPDWLFFALAIILIIWTFPILVALLFVMPRVPPQRKVDKLVRSLAAWGEPISWHLSDFVLLISILSNWTKLRDGGMTGGWVDGLLYLGILIYLVIAIYQIRKIGVK